MTEQLHFHFSLSCIGEGNGNPLQCSCLENSSDGGAWWAAVYGVAQSRTRLKRLSSSSRYWMNRSSDTILLLLLLFKKNKVDLKCVNFCCIAKLFSYYMCIYIYIYIYTLFLNIFFHYGLSQDIESSSLCYVVGPCCLYN